MQKVTLNKTITARKLSPSGVLTSDPEEPIPFGAIIEGIQRDRDTVRFRYLGYLYRCPYEMLASAIDRESKRDEPAAAAAAPAAAAPAPAAAESTLPKLRFEAVPSNRGTLYRAKVPGGWLLSSDGGVTFYPDPEHAWDRSSL